MGRAREADVVDEGALPRDEFGVRDARDLLTDVLHCYWSSAGTIRPLSAISSSSR